jgi:hypothetical protein
MFQYAKIPQSRHDYVVQAQSLLVQQICLNGQTFVALVLAVVGLLLVVSFQIHGPSTEAQGVHHRGVEHRSLQE